MSKPRRHWKGATGRPACGRIILDRTTITEAPDEVTCPQCLRRMRGGPDEAADGDPEAQAMVVCADRFHPDCHPTCIHSRPHLANTTATVGEFPHLASDTLRDCSHGPCCTRPGLRTECVEAVT